MAVVKADVTGELPVMDPPNRVMVRFGSVRVRKHPMTLGDNPGGIAKGPPLTIDWEHIESEHFSTVDGFMAKYPSCIKGAKSLFRLSGQERRAIVSGHHSDEDIARAESEIKMIRLKRKESAGEEDEGSIKSMIRKKQAERKKKKEPRVFGLLGSFSLGRRRRAPTTAS